MTLNELIKKANQVSWMLTSGDIPLTMNGQPIEIYDITLEGNNGNYWADLKVITNDRQTKTSDSSAVKTDGTKEHHG